MGYKLYLLEECDEFAKLLKVSFQQESFEIQIMNSPNHIFEQCKHELPDMLLFDIVIPNQDGLDLIRDIRKLYDTPIIILSSKVTEMDEILALKLGADDFLRKPVSVPILIQRCKNLLERISKQKQPKTTLKNYGDFELDVERFTCHWKGQPLEFTVTEFQIVEALLNRPGFVKTREQLLDSAYGEKIYVDDRTIDTHIKHIRQKFKKIDPEFTEIETVYGLGYRLKEKVE